MKVCIVCQKDVEGQKAVQVKEDRIIKLIRYTKNLFHIAQNNQLYVCEADIPKHLERRKSFEKSMLFASVFAGLIILILIGALFLSGKFDAWALVSAVIVAGFVLILPLFKYSPAIEQPAPSAMAINVPTAKSAKPSDVESKPKAKRKPKR